MIPKIIHYCWFGPKQIPQELLDYIETWKVYCPEYTLKLWNEHSFDVSSHPFTHSAYEAKKFAYVSDYVRAYALHNFGGIYLDTDVELKHNLDIFLTHEAFTGFESIGSPFTAVWGSIAQHSLTEKILNYYQDRIYSLQEPTNTASVSDILINDFNINPLSNTKQIGTDGRNTISIYTSTTFCLDLDINFATHHFSGSWVQDRKKSFKVNVHEKYLIESLESYPSIYSEKEFLRVIARKLTLVNLVQLIRYFLKNKF